ncbi:amino acid adenylation domain-containing protein, partial [Streptomyces coeruleorubidus]|uniref:amino acid adenylation domain-containing protein n=1 Tax=Streptomyces coeruleorubidus TaxID=116188 RepID=UPI003703C4C7
EHVRRTPQALAVEDGAVRLDYRSLWRRAGALARCLPRDGSPVAVLAPRGWQSVVAELAAWRASRPFLPLDPAHPAAHLQAIAVDAGAGALLRQTGFELDLALPAWDIEASSVDDADDGDEALPDAADVAYVIYTSGSTGRPKGVMVEHRSVVNRLAWMQSAYGLQPGEPVLLKTPFSFDVSVWEFFWPLMTGARLFMARPEGHKDPQYLAETVQRERITTMHFVPSMLQAFLELADPAQCRGLVRVMCSGEALPGALARRFRELLPHTQLHNLYGPTEAAVDVTAWACDTDELPDNIPIGRPIANTAIYLLDRHGQPVPAGSAGELHIGGVQVARGYLNRPELSAERFVHDPFSPRPGARMYKTGDLARWQADGSLLYLGRNDLQVKFRCQLI